MLNITCGVGLLSVPLCFSKSGYAGVVVLWVLGLIAAYTAKALCRCSQTVAKQLKKQPGEMVRYEEIAEAALGGKVGRSVVSFIMYTELIGTCALFLILESDNVWNLLGSALKDVAARFGTQIGTLQTLLGTHEGIFWVCAMVIVPTVLAPNVKSLAVLGIAGFAATMTVTVAVAWTLLTGAAVPLCACDVLVLLCHSVVQCPETGDLHHAVFVLGSIKHGCAI